MDQIPLVVSLLFSLVHKYLSLVFGVLMTPLFNVISSLYYGALPHDFLRVITTFLSSFDDKAPMGYLYFITFSLMD